MKPCAKQLKWNSTSGGYEYCTNGAVGGIQYRAYTMGPEVAFFCDSHLEGEIERERMWGELITVLEGTLLPPGATIRTRR